MPRITVGVDIGKESHQAAAYDSVGDRVVRQLKFDFSRAGFTRLLTFLAELGREAADLVVGLEATGHYHLALAEFLAGCGYTVVLLNPGQATRFRRAEGRCAKTDRVDARSLARFLAVNPPEPTPQPDDTLSGVRELTRLRTELVHNRTAAVRRMHGAVDLAFPELPQVLVRLPSRSTLALPAAYATVAAIAAANPDALTALLRRASRGQLRAAKVGALVTAARASIALRPRQPMRAPPGRT